MDARPLRRMTFGNEVIAGGSHAPEESYPRPPAGLSRRRRAPASPPPVPRLQAQGLGPDPPGPALGRRGPDHLAVRRLRTPPRRPLRRDRTPGPAGHAARLRHAATAAQRRVGRAPARGAAPAAPAAGHRPDADPLPRPGLPHRRRGPPAP